VPGRSLEPLGFLIHMYENRCAGRVLMLVSMYGGCIERDSSWMIHWECSSI
jgi:hypothetical protein